MSKKPAPPRTSDEGRSADEVRADDPRRSMQRLADLTRKVLKVPKEVIDQLREGSGVT